MIIVENFETESRRIEFGIDVELFDIDDESLELTEGIVLEKTEESDLPF